MKFSANDKILNLAMENIDTRLKSMDQFRDQLSAQAQTFLSRAEAQLQIEKLINRIVLLEKGLNYREGTRHWTDYLLTAIIAGAIVVISRLMHL